MSSVEPVRRLPNFVDASAELLARRDAAAASLTRLLALRGYERIEPPLLEQAELFVRKSGGELSSRLYGFVEPGGYRVGLRPELTAPVLRHAIETAAGRIWPRRFQYTGPVFRYASPEDQDGQKTRQFTQLGAEIIGSSSAAADGEVLASALDGLRSLGIPNPIAVIGHVGILWELLKPFDLSDRARLFLVNSVDQLRNGSNSVDAARSEAKRLGLTGEGQEVASSSPLPAGSLLADVSAVIDATIGPTDANAGVRTRTEIVERLAKKQMMTSDPESFSQAFDFMTQVACVNGAPGAAIAGAESVVAKAGGAGDALTPLKRIIAAAEAEGVDSASLGVDFGLARGIAYYTGMVFDLHSGDSQRDSLGGGGRYDGLTRALGAADDVPALGFAYNLDAVLDAMDRDPTSVDVKQRVLVSPAGLGAVNAAVQEAARLRTSGKIATLDLEVRDATNRRAYASQIGASEILVVTPDGSVNRELLR